MSDVKKPFHFNGYPYEISFNPKAKGQFIEVAGQCRIPAISYFKEKKQVLVIGAGWYGCHIALVLKKAHPEWDVSLYEKGNELFSGVSGEFGIRLHAGPHYPRSKKTREDCHKGFKQFCACYPEIINSLAYAIYALGTTDADGNPSKVTEEEFARVCKEFGNASEVPWKEMGYDNLHTAFNLDEPSVILGEPLRRFFKEKLKKAGVSVVTNTNVTRLEKKGNGIAVNYVRGLKEKRRVFDHVVNATSYQALLPPGPDLPLNIEVVYQVCLALVYKHKVKPRPKKAFSFIVMDGWFPCLMPYDDRINKSKPAAKYILTHGKYTLHSFKTAKEAHVFLASMKDKQDVYVEKAVKKKCEAEMRRFYPKFQQEFKYVDWKGAVLAKPKTEKEFRSAFTFQDKREVIHVFPGKISNIFSAVEEVEQLIEKLAVVKEGQYAYAKNGVLDQARKEISEKPNGMKGNTSGLKSFNDYYLHKGHKKMSFWERQVHNCLPAMFLTPEGANLMDNYHI